MEKAPLGEPIDLALYGRTVYGCRKYTMPDYLAFFDSNINTVSDEYIFEFSAWRHRPSPPKTIK